MRKNSLAALGAIAAMAGSIAFSSQPALAIHNSVFYGRIVHVSTDNIKVQDPKSGQTLGFLIAPKFKNVFTKEGRHATQEMAFLHEGMPVEVLYDQKALGARHADKIVELRRLPRQ